MESSNLLMENSSIKSFSTQNGSQPELSSSFLPVVCILGGYFQNTANTMTHLLYIAFELLCNSPLAKELYKNY